MGIQQEPDWAGVSPRDPGALDRIIAAFGEAIFKFLRLMLRDAEVARDLTQDTFLRVFQSGGKFESATSLKTWLYRTAQRLAVDHFRRRKAFREKLGRLGGPSESESAGERAESEQLREEVRNALAELPEGCRATLILVEMEGLSYREIAKVEGGAEAAARQRAAYARKLLREKLAARFGLKQDKK